MKYTRVCVLFPIFVFCISCGTQNKTGPPKENTRSGTKDASASRWMYTQYGYTDPMGAGLTIQNSFPKGVTKYTDPDGEVYNYAVFWTWIINETVDPFELTIDFPVDSYELPSLPGKYFKILLPSDTMTLDKEPLHDYGLTNFFFDSSTHKPSFLKRKINPKESSGFYVVILFDNGVPGPVRTGLSIKG